MFRKSDNANSPRSSAVTIIGAGVRIEGDIAFSGFLRIQGVVLGNVSCDSDSSGTTAVHNSGSVTGTIKTPHIVVGGRVHGPLNASESIEIHRDAYVVGDACYRQIAIHAGGVIDGSLTPTAPTAGDRSRPERRIRVSESPVVKECDIPLENSRRSTERFRVGRKLGAAAVLTIAIVAAAWFGRHRAVIAPPVAAVAHEPEPPATSVSAARSAPAVSDEPERGQKAVPGNTGPLVPDPNAQAKVAVPAVSVVPPAPADRPKADMERVVTVQGMDPDKPADNFFVIGKEPSVLFRKQRKDPADGTRIDVAKGANKRIPIAENEILRVAEGRNIEIFYQGRKVPPQVIENGAWIGFVPQSAGGESGSR